MEKLNLYNVYMLVTEIGKWQSAVIKISTHMVYINTSAIVFIINLCAFLSDEQDG